MGQSFDGGTCFCRACTREDLCARRAINSSRKQREVARKDFWCDDLSMTNPTQPEGQFESTPPPGGTASANAREHLSSLEAENAALRLRIAQLEALISAHSAPTIAPLAAPDHRAGNAVVAGATPLRYATTTPPRVPPAVGNPSPPAVPTLTSSTAVPATADSSRTEPGFELFVGRNIVPFMGAIAVLAAIGFLVDYGIEIGLFGRMPAEFRFGIGIVASFALLGAGEISRRRWSAAAAVGLDAAGVGGLMVSVALGVFSLGLFGPATGALCVMGAGIFGVAWSIRADSLVVALVAVIGLFGSVAGFDLFREHPLLAANHLTVALAAALSLPAFGGHRFWPIRYLALVAILLLGTVTVFGRLPDVTNTGFAAAWWGLFAVEATFAALRGRNRIANAWLLAIASTAMIAMHAANWTGFLGFAPLCVAAALLGQALFLRGFAVEGDDEEAPPMGQAHSMGQAPFSRRAAVDGAESDAGQTRAVASACGLLALTASGLAIAAGLDGIASMIDYRAIAPLLCAGALTAAWIATRVRFPLFDVVAVLAALGAFIAAIVATSSQPGGFTSAPTVSTPALFGIFPVTWDLSIEILVLAAVALALMSASKIGARLVAAIMLALIGAIAWISASAMATDGDFARPCMVLPAFIVMWMPRATLTMVITALALAFTASATWVVMILSGFYRFGDDSLLPGIGAQLAFASVATVLMANHPRLGKARLTLTIIMVIFGGLEWTVFGSMVGRSYGLSAQNLVLLFIVIQALMGALIMASARLINKPHVAISGAWMSALSVLIGAFMGFVRLFSYGESAADNPWLAYCAVLSAALAYLVARVFVVEQTMGSSQRRVADAIGAAAIAPLGALAIAAALGGSIAGPFAAIWMVIVASTEVLLGFRRDWAPLRWAGLATLFMLVARLYAVDLVGTPAPMRIALLFISGLVLVTVGIIYARKQRAAT